MRVPVEEIIKKLDEDIEKRRKNCNHERYVSIFDKVGKKKIGEICLDCNLKTIIVKEVES